jgi:DNA-binding response OmpR family regulator
VPIPKILLADDEPSLRRLVSVTLGSDDFQLLHASNGEEALAVARQELPQVALLDINMPRKNGIEVCRALKSDPATRCIKVVMLTAAGSESDIELALAAGADAYFVKPFSPLALLNQVHALIR